MSYGAAILLALFCVGLTASAQVLLKMGMSAPVMQQALSAGMSNVIFAAVQSPLIWGGMACFGASAGLWLLVLGRIEVSTAYPLISLGVVLTTLAGIFVLGEAASASKLIGVGLVVAGVLVLAIKQ